MVSIAASSSAPAFIDNYLSKSTWLFLVSGVYFQFFFILEIFKDGVFNKKNHPAVLFFTVVNVMMYGLIIFSLFNDYFKALDADISQIIVILGFAVAIVSLVAAFSVQTTTSFKIFKSVTEPIYKRSVLFIGISGICFMCAIFSEFFEEVARILIDDVAVRTIIVEISTIFSPVASLAGGMLIYLGYIYPARIKVQQS
jgi:hypothetical protein